MKKYIPPSRRHPAIARSIQRRGGLGDLDRYGVAVSPHYAKPDPNTHAPEGGYNEDHVFNRDARSDFELFTGPVRRMTQYSFSIANVATLILPANFRRTYLIVQNLSAAAVNLYLGFNSAVNASNGIRIAAGGNYLGDYNCPTDDIWVFFDNAAIQNGVVAEGILA